VDAVAARGAIHSFLDDYLHWREWRATRNAVTRNKEEEGESRILGEGAGGIRVEPKVRASAASPFLLTLWTE